MMADEMTRLSEPKRHIVWTPEEEKTAREWASIGMTGGEIYGLLLGVRYDQLTADLAALRAERAWRPIESAPKGTDILLVSGYGSTFIGSWSGPDKEWWDGERFLYGTDQPTHWMPLPPLPEGVAS